MSRIGKKPIPVPKGVEIKTDGAKISVKGPKGSLSREIPECLNLQVDGEQVVLTLKASEADSRVKALWGLNRVLVANMVEGVNNGYKKALQITGVGYKAELMGKDLKLTVGLSNPATVTAIDGVVFSTEGPTRIVVEGSDKQLVGEVAAEIRGIRPPEPYKGKGIRYADEIIRRKAGKTAVK